MAPFLIGIVATLALFYAALMGAFAVGFHRVTRQRSAPALAPDEWPVVTVVIPVRDEAENIERCLESVLANDYPAGRFEVIVVDDDSLDDTVARVRRVQSRYELSLAGGEIVAEPPRLRLLQMPENRARARAHKKFALQKGIEAARGEIILTTDADCRVGRRWMTTMVSRFAPATGLVSGAVLYDPADTHLARFQSLEFLGLIAIGAGAIGIGRPLLCNGANVAYRRKAFEEVNGFLDLDHVTSGDDDLLLQKLAYSSRWDVAFCADERAAVETEPPADYRAYVDQQRRWASNGARYDLRGLVVVNVLIYLFFWCLLLGLPAAVMMPILRLPLLAALLLKVAVEGAVLWQVARRYGRRRLVWYLLPGQLLQIPHILLVSTLGVFFGYTWKGRDISR